MRTQRRFRPALECMTARISPSSIAVAAPDAASSGTYSTASIGDPTSTTPGSGSNQVILAPPTTTTTTQMC